MAKKDVYEYEVMMLNQYLEMQKDLADFNDAFAAGYITEDKLEDVKADVARLKENYDRIQYICFLLKQPRFKIFMNKKSKQLEANFKDVKADSGAVSEENKAIIAQVKQKIKKLLKKNKSK